MNVLQKMKRVKTRRITFPFPVADTLEGPTITWDSFSLLLKFTDYQSQQCVVHFEDVSHYEFLVEDELDSKSYQYDGAVEVINSTLIERLVEIGEVDRSDSAHFRHIVIGFNEIGAYLVVVCRGFEPRKAEQAVPPKSDRAGG